MTYTRDEWEPASQEAAKIAEDKLRGRLIETMIISERRRRLNCLRQNQIAELREKLEQSEIAKYTVCAERDRMRRDLTECDKEIKQLREKLSNCDEALKHTNGVMRQKFNQVAELRERLDGAGKELTRWMFDYNELREQLATATERNAQLEYAMGPHALAAYEKTLQERDELREKLAAAESENTQHCQRRFGELEDHTRSEKSLVEERDRLRAILEDVQPYVPSADFKLRARIREALSQPAEGTRE